MSSSGVGASWWKPIWFGPYPYGVKQAGAGALFQGIRGAPRDWIDRAVPAGEEVAILYTGAADRFTVNINDLKNPQEAMRDMIESGHEWGAGATPGSAREGTLDLDRILHHEERHSQQGADKGPLLLGIDYGTGYYMDQHGMTNPLEEDAGLHDGGYTR